MTDTTHREPETTEYLSFRTERIAKARARVWANLNSRADDSREVEVGEVFEVYTWQGSGFVTYWLRYDVENDGHGNYVISSTRYFTNPEA